jgi:hypothetical protein
MQNDQEQNRSLRFNIVMLASLAFILIFGLVACNPATTPTFTPTKQATPLPTITMDGNALPFETIEQDVYAVDTGKLYESREPGIIIISHVEKIDNLVGLVSLEGIMQLRALDYSQYFALAAFQGRKGSLGYYIQRAFGNSK